jgi:hypothetical protein
MNATAMSTAPGANASAGTNNAAPGTSASSMGNNNQTATSTGSSASASASASPSGNNFQVANVTKIADHCTPATGSPSAAPRSQLRPGATVELAQATGGSMGSTSGGAVGTSNSGAASTGQTGTALPTSVTSPKVAARLGRPLRRA